MCEWRARCPYLVLLELVNVTQADVDQLLWFQQRLDRELFIGVDTEKKRNGHAVIMVRLRRCSRVDIGMRVDPNDYRVSLLATLQKGRHCPQAHGVIAADIQRFRVALD